MAPSVAPSLRSHRKIRDAARRFVSRSDKLLLLLSLALSMVESRLNPIRTDFEQRPITRWAHPARRVVQIAHTMVAGLLGKLTERHRPRDTLRGVVVNVLGANDPFGWSSVLDPVFQRGKRIDAVRSRSTDAMLRSG